MSQWTWQTCLPFFFGPLHITASSGEDSRKPIDITQRLSWTYCRKRKRIIIGYILLYMIDDYYSFRETVFTFIAKKYVSAKVTSRILL